MQQMPVVQQQLLSKMRNFFKKALKSDKNPDNSAQSCFWPATLLELLSERFYRPGNCHL